MNRKMQYAPCRRLLAVMLMGGVWLAAPRPLVAQVNIEASVQANLEAGQQALATRNYEAALERWQQGLGDVQAWGATQYEATYYFKLGLVWQAWGEAALDAGNDELAMDRLRRAELEYQTLLEHTPSSAGTYNNLARIYDQMGRPDDASDAYERAVAVEDDRQPVFMLNYADFLRRQGRHSTAIGYYQRVLEGQPENPRALKGLAEAYRASDRPALIGYMWDLINGGHEVRALDIALDELTTAEWTGADAVIEQQKTALLTCIVMGLSLGSYAPEAFLASDRARLLTALSGNDRHIGRGAREILQVHLPEALAEASFDWWASQGNVREDPPPGRVWPREAFRRLIRARGAWHEEQGQEAVAQDYYFLSVRLPGEGTDPEALLHLAKMYFRTGATERIDALMNRYAEDLFTGKMNAVSKVQWAKAYEYHRTLGAMYAYLNQWGDASTPTSAIFQLEEARRDAARYNEAGQAAGSAQRIRVETQMIDYLAEGYEATDNPRAAMVVRLEAAELYERQGDLESTTQVLKPLESRSLPADLQVRYERLQQDRSIERMPNNNLERLDDSQRLDDVRRQNLELQQEGVRARVLEQGLEEQPVESALTVYGLITEAGSGRPLAGVTVLDRQSETTAVTDRQGIFTLRSIQGHTLIFNLEGYKEATWTVTAESPRLSLERER